MSAPSENRPIVPESARRLEAASVCRALIDELEALVATVDSDRYLSEEEALIFLESVPEERITEFAEIAAGCAVEIYASGNGVTAPNVLCSPDDTPDGVGTIEIRGGRELDMFETARGTFSECFIEANPVELQDGSTVYDPQVQIIIALREQIPISYAPYIRGAFMQYAVVDLTKNPSITLPAHEERDQLFNLLEQMPKEVDQGTFELMDLGLCIVRGELDEMPGQTARIRDIFALRESAEIASTLCETVDPELVAQFIELRLRLNEFLVRADSSVSIPVQRVWQNQQDPAEPPTISWLQIPANAKNPKVCIGQARGIIIYAPQAVPPNTHPFILPHTPLLVLESQCDDGALDTSYVPLSGLTALACASQIDI